MTTRRLDYLDASAADLAALWRTGASFDPTSLAGWSFAGISLNLPGLVDRLLWKKFAKEFALRPDGRVRGWNVRIEQDALTAPWRAQQRGGQRRTFGHFAVERQPHQVMIDYGAAGGLMAAARDPVVALDGRGDLLLGRGQLVVLGRYLDTPSYFVLERDRRLTEAETETAPPRLR